MRKRAVEKNQVTLYVYFWIHNEQFCNGTKDEIELSTLYHDWKRHQDRVSYIPGSFKIQAYCMLHTACHLERDLLKSNVSGYRSYSVVIRPSSLLAPWKHNKSNRCCYRALFRITKGKNMRNTIPINVGPRFQG